MHALNWFEIPCTDFDRAVNFYEQLLQITLRREMFGGSMPNAVFPYNGETGGVGGAVAKTPYAKPGLAGTILYLAVSSMEIFDEALNRAEALGGKVLLTKTSLGPQGHIALVQDTEGNHLGLHIPNRPH